MTYMHLFGPVPSRRLGVSLGIDLIPMKTCSYNCIYCECGKTTDLIIERKEFISTEEVISELDDYLSKSPELDFITYSGSGEPTLHSGVGEITRHIKENFPEYRIALLTNGSLFYDKNVRDEVQGIDVIVPSLDAATETTFKKIDRPHSSLKVDTIVQGLADLRNDFEGEIWLEIFIVPGLNDTPDEIAALNSAINQIRPERVQLNTLDRPGVVDWIKPASPALMQQIADAIEHPHVEVTGKASSRTAIASFSGDILESILQTIQRRPCTVEDLSRIFGLHENEINKYIQVLVEEQKIREKREERGIFFLAL